MILTELCPCCEKETECQLIGKHDTIPVRSEPIRVPVIFYRCRRCSTEFRPHCLCDPLDLVYRIYRSRHRMLQPHHVFALRYRLALTQTGLDRRLGWNYGRAEQIEKGALQTKEEEHTLRALQDA